MSLLRSITSGLRSLLRKEQVSQELDEELNGFLEMAAEEKRKQGMNRKDALRAVRLERGISKLQRKSSAPPAGNPFLRPCGKICATRCGCSAEVPYSRSWLWDFGRATAPRGAN